MTTNVSTGSYIRVRFVAARSVHTGRPTSEVTACLPAGTDVHAYAKARGWEVAEVALAPSVIQVLRSLDSLT